MALPGTAVAGPGVWHRRAAPQLEAVVMEAELRAAGALTADHPGDGGGLPAHPQRVNEPSACCEEEERLQSVGQHPARQPRADGEGKSG